MDQLLPRGPRHPGDGGVHECGNRADARADQANRTIFNRAVTLSAMRRLMMQPIDRYSRRVTAGADTRVMARILPGGKADSYSGFLPGIFELVDVAVGSPGLHSRRLWRGAEIWPRRCWYRGQIVPGTDAIGTGAESALVALLQSAGQFATPPHLGILENSSRDLFTFVLKARANLTGTLSTGLSDQETRSCCRRAISPTLSIWCAWG